MRLFPGKKCVISEDSSEFSFEHVQESGINGDSLYRVKEKSGLKKSRKAASLFLLIFIGSLFFLRAVDLEVIRGRAFDSLYNTIHRQKEWILPPRGLILDRNGVTLAQNAPGKKENELSRIYPDGALFSHILGFISRATPSHLSQDPYYLPFDFVGQTGVEAEYEKFLRGEHGSIEKPVTVRGEMVQGPITTPPKAGNNITLTIDSEFQKKLYESLEEQVKKFHAPGAAGIVMNPRTGGVLALVSIPVFDNNIQASYSLKDPAKPLFNRAIAGEYPSGSTIKPFLASAALKEHIIAPETIVHDRGKIEVQSIYNPNTVWTFRGWKVLGDLDMRRAIAMSSNVYFYTIGGGYSDIKGLGIYNIHKYLSLYGWGKKTGIDLPGEGNGLLPLPEWKKENFGEEWYIGDTYNTSIGQGFLRATPLQLAQATSVIANNGALFKPYVMDYISTQEGKRIITNTPEIIRKDFIDSAYLQVAREGMRQAVEYGTVKRLGIEGVTIAAKTGTAQAGTGKPNHGWVTIFAPYENPEIVLTILIENGEGGEQSAVPVAKNFLEWYFNKSPQSNPPAGGQNPNVQPES